MQQSKENGFERWRGAVTEQLLHITETLGELGTRFEKALALQVHASEDHKRFQNMESRLTAVEKSTATLVGKITVYGILVGGTVGILADVVFNRLF